jgi:hypothetical protein
VKAISRSTKAQKKETYILQLCVKGVKFTVQEGNVMGGIATVIFG